MDSEQYLKIGTVIVLFLYILNVSTVFEISYPPVLVELYTRPWWRILLVLLIAIGWWWSPIVGVLVGTAVFFYLHDVYILLSKKITNN
jgi:hypothetical protein